VLQQIRAAKAKLDSEAENFRALRESHVEERSALCKAQEKALSDFQQEQAFERSALERKIGQENLDALKKQKEARQEIKRLEEEAEKLRVASRDYDAKLKEYGTAAAK
jgi:hypothetical protein